MKGFTREELNQKIKDLPLFEKRTLKVNTTINPESEDYTKDEDHIAICAVGSAKPEAFASKDYALIQFGEIFTPIMESVPGDLHGYLIQYGGYAQLSIFPEDPRLKDESGHFGLVAVNSVDCSSSVIVKFCIETNYMKVTIPPRIAGIKKAHTKNVSGIVQDYISMVGSVKTAWRKIATEFPLYKVVMQTSPEGDHEIELKPLLEQLELGQRMDKVITDRYDEVTLNQGTFTLWDVFVTAVHKVSDSEYKSDVHREKKMDKLSNAIFDYATALSI